MLPSNLWLCWARQDDAPTAKEARRQEHPDGVHGLRDGIKAYKMYSPVTKRVHVSRDVIFNEEACWNWEAPASSSFTVEYTVCTSDGARAATPSTMKTLSRASPSSTTLGTDVQQPQALRPQAEWLQTQRAQQPRGRQPQTPQARLC